MHRRLLTAFAIVALCALTACGDKDEGPAASGQNPFGVGETPPSTSPDDLLKGTHMPAGMPDLNDPEALRKWAEKQAQNPELLQQQAKDQLEKMGLGKMPDVNDPEAMREWKEDMHKRGAEMMDRFAGEVSEDDLKQYAEIRDELKAAKGDTAKLMALYKQHGGMMQIMKVMKVPAALKAYEMRRDGGSLTDKDKANAAVYEKYLKLLDED